MNSRCTLEHRLVRIVVICNRGSNKRTSRAYNSPNNENSKSEARNPKSRLRVEDPRDTGQAQIIKIQNRKAFLKKICIENFNTVSPLEI